MSESALKGKCEKYGILLEVDIDTTSLVRSTLQVFSMVSYTTYVAGDGNRTSVERARVRLMLGVMCHITDQIRSRSKQSRIEFLCLYSDDTRFPQIILAPVAYANFHISSSMLSMLKDHSH